MGVKRFKFNCSYVLFHFSFFPCHIQYGGLPQCVSSDMGSPNLSDVKIISWNVSGLNKLTKLKQVMYRLKTYILRYFFCKKFISQLLKLNKYNRGGLDK